jgi:hypothetical protein
MKLPRDAHAHWGWNDIAPLGVRTTILKAHNCVEDGITKKGPPRGPGEGRDGNAAMSRAPARAAFSALQIRTHTAMRFIFSWLLCSANAAQRRRWVATSMTLRCESQLSKDMLVVRVDALHRVYPPSVRTMPRISQPRSGPEALRVQAQCIDLVAQGFATEAQSVGRDLEDSIGSGFGVRGDGSAGSVWVLDGDLDPARCTGLQRRRCQL